MKRTILYMLFIMGIVGVGAMLLRAASEDQFPFRHNRALLVDVSGIPQPMATDVSAWAVYDGNTGTGSALQTAADANALGLLTNAPGNITITNATTGIAANAVRVWLMNTTASQSCTLCVGQFTSAGVLQEVTETTIPTTNLGTASNQNLWGLTAGTYKAPKAPVVVTFTRHATTSVVRLWVQTSLGGAWYARYQTLSVPAASPVSGLTNTELRAAAVVASVSGTATVTPATGAKFSTWDPNGPTAAQLTTALANQVLQRGDANSILVAAQTSVLPLTDSWPKKVTTGATALLSASVTFPAGTFKMTLVPHSTETIYLEKTTAAAATSPIIPSGGISFVATKAVADVLAVMSANASALSVYVNQ